MAKSVGLVVKLEADLDEEKLIEGAAIKSKEEFDSFSKIPRQTDKSMNKITINMYDKELMPVVDELYLND